MIHIRVFHECLVSACLTLMPRVNTTVHNCTASSDKNKPVSRVKTMMLSYVSSAQDTMLKFCHPEDKGVWLSSSIMVMREVSPYWGRWVSRHPLSPHVFIYAKLVQYLLIALYVWGSTPQFYFSPKEFGGCRKKCSHSTQTPQVSGCLCSIKIYLSATFLNSAQFFDWIE